MMEKKIAVTGAGYVGMAMAMAMAVLLTQNNSTEIL